MRDATTSLYDRLTSAIETLGTYLTENGYQPIDTPILEETELFVRKSGGELTSRLYTFNDPGGHRVSLRPEFTSSVIRHFVQERPNTPTPVRWQYAGPVFRYEEGENGPYRQFTQVGAELVGASGVGADSEILGVAAGGLRRIGLTTFQVRVGHLGLIRGLLSAYGLSEPAKLFIISNVHAFKSRSTDVPALQERAEQMGLLRTGPLLGEETGLDWSIEATQRFLHNMLRESIPASSGQRTTEQIVARLLRKVSDADDPGKFEEALELVGDLALLTGEPEAVVREARRIVSDRGVRMDPFDELEGLFDELEKTTAAGHEFVLDLGLARGISYYTGVIFEITTFEEGEEVSLGGGGRYDGLVKALGGEDDVPALGFAYNLDRAIDLGIEINAGQPQKR